MLSALHILFYDNTDGQIRENRYEYGMRKRNDSTVQGGDQPLADRAERAVLSLDGSEEGRWAVLVANPCFQTSCVYAAGGQRDGAAPCQLLQG